MSVTIYEVAEAAGVSIKTVSRVLNGEAHVREALRERVAAAVERLGYRPSRSARALAGSGSSLIAAFVDAELTVEHLRSGRGNDYLSRLELGALIECREAGRHLMVELIDHGSRTLERDVALLISSLRPDGVLLTPPISDSRPVMDVLERTETPYVRIGPERELDRGSRVYMDDRGAIQEVARRLIALGHRRIAFLAGSPRYNASEVRRQGFVDAMAEAKLQVRAEWMLQGDFTFESGLACAELLLSGRERPTAVVASNDDMALAVVQTARRFGVDVPGELSVTGFDDTPSAQFSVPPLTTVRQPVAEMSAHAVRRLLGAAFVERADHALIERGSTSSPDPERYLRVAPTLRS